MTIGIAPVTGITLPFVSVGGSSLVANLVAIGVLEAIHVRGRRGREPEGCRINPRDCPRRRAASCGPARETSGPLAVLGQPGLVVRAAA